MAKVLAIIPARGGSKRIPRKNLVELDGVPLLDYTARAALNARGLVAAVVSTDAPDIAKHAIALGLANPVIRPPELSGDESDTVDAVVHAALAYEARHGPVDAVMVLQPTSPFRTSRHVEEALALHSASGADTVTSVRVVHDHPYWTWKREDSRIVPLFGHESVVLGRNALPTMFAENGAIYIARRELIARRTLYGPHVVPYVMDEHSSVDIDCMQDLLWARFLLTNGLVTRLP